MATKKKKVLTPIEELEATLVELRNDAEDLLGRIDSAEGDLAELTNDAEEDE